MPTESTKERIVGAGGELFSRQGYAATGVKQIVAAASAPFGSLYHFFPGGKAELAEEVIRSSGGIYQQLIDAVFDPAPDIVTAVRNFFDGAAETLRRTDYADACPIATVALEVASTNEQLRQATADVFEGWISTTAHRFSSAGISARTSRELATFVLATLEGAFVLARAAHDASAVQIAGTHAAAAVEKALAGAATRTQS